MSNAGHALITTIGKLDTHSTTAATAILWCASLTLYASRLLPQLPNAPLPAFDVSEALLLALACVAFQLSTLRIGLEHLTHIWHGTIDPAGHQRANPTRWKVFGWIGTLSWLAALAIGAVAAAGAWPNIDSTDLIFALAIVLAPAVQCTSAAVIGPILTNAIEERETALAAHDTIQAVRAATRERSHREA